MHNAGNKCLIIVGGEYAPLSEDILFDYVIACDKGYEYADRMGIKYDVIIGDFDSASSFPSSNVPVIQLPVEKDDTDTMFAVKYALDKSYRDIYIVCAFGGRLDHSIANMQTAEYVASHGGLCHLYGKDNELHSFKDTSLSFVKNNDAYISVFSLSERSEGVTIKGTKYIADKIEMSSDFPIGVSNEWESDIAEISVDKGILGIVISKKN